MIHTKQKPPQYRFNPIAISTTRHGLNKDGSNKTDPSKPSMTLGNASTILNMKYSRYSRIEKGLQVPTIAELIRIANAFSVDMLAFFVVSVSENNASDGGAENDA